MDTGTMVSHAREKTKTSDKEILKKKGDRKKIQNDATFSKFESGNQFDEDDKDISKSTAEKRAILHLSNEVSCKLLLLASALENSDTSKKMLDSKLQKRLFDSGKQLTLKEFKYDSKPLCTSMLLTVILQSTGNCFEQCGIV